MVGDRWRDVEAGARGDCRTVVIDYGYAAHEPAVPPDRRVRTLGQAVAWILSGAGRGCARPAVTLWGPAAA